jgi:type I restriction enzyme R subunit
MYIYKPMSGHTLMQAIARVNRVCKDKQGGLVVDYVGIARALRQAMNDYTRRDKENYGDPDIGKTAYPKFLEKLDVCRDLFHGFDFSGFFTGSDLVRARLITGGVNFISEPKKAEQKIAFIKESLLLRHALTLCRSLLNQEERFEAAYFDAVRTILTRIEGKGKLSLKEINARINELLKQSIQSKGVINLFSDVDETYSLFDAAFLAEIAKMKEKNLAVELLKKLLAEQVVVYARTNVVKSAKFSELLNQAMNTYIKGMLTNEQVIEELLKMAKEMTVAQKEGEELGLTVEELAFYDALTKPEAVKDFYENDELVAITKELTELLRKNKTIDWQKKETARAGMRRLVKRLLKEHKYPPTGLEDAVTTVLAQCEMWTDNPGFEEEGLPAAF